MLRIPYYLYITVQESLHVCKLWNMNDQPSPHGLQTDAIVAGMDIPSAPLRHKQIPDIDRVNPIPRSNQLYYRI